MRRLLQHLTPPSSDWAWPMWTCTSSTSQLHRYVVITCCVISSSKGVSHQSDRNATLRHDSWRYAPDGHQTNAQSAGGDLCQRQSAGHWRFKLHRHSQCLWQSLMISETSGAAAGSEQGQAHGQPGRVPSPALPEGGCLKCLHANDTVAPAILQIPGHPV
jgi:hypothetical protein